MSNTSVFIAQGQVTRKNLLHRKKSWHLGFQGSNPRSRMPNVALQQKESSRLLVVGGFAGM